MNSAQITVDGIMSWGPGEDWPRERVEAGGVAGMITGFGDGESYVEFGSTNSGWLSRDEIRIIHAVDNGE